MLHENVVRMAVAVGARDPDAFAGGAMHERQFGESPMRLVPRCPAGM
jgi:hypothetical protein